MQLPLQGAHDTLGRFTQGAVLPLRSRTLPWAGSSCPFGALHLRAYARALSSTRSESADSYIASQGSNGKLEHKRLTEASALGASSLRER